MNRVQPPCRRAAASEGREQEAARFRVPSAEAPLVEDATSEHSSTPDGADDPTAAPAGDQRDQRREQLLEVGAQLFATRGYDQVPIDEIAAAARMSRGLLYHYFPSKQAFHLAVVERTLAEVRQLLAPDPDLPPVQALTDVLHRFFTYVGEHDVGVLALARGEAGTGARLPSLLEAFREGTVEQVLTALEQLDLAPEPSPALRTALRGWTGAVEGLAVGWLAHGDPRSADERERLVELAGALLTTCLTSTGVTLPPPDDDGAPRPDPR